MDDQSKFYRQKGFSRLQKQWYKKLTKAGFSDIEQDELHLKTWSSQFSRQKSIDSAESKEHYFYLATQFLNDHTFTTKLERIVWEYHTEGLQVPDIVKLLKTVRIPTTKHVVAGTVKRLRLDMYQLYGVTNE